MTRGGGRCPADRLAGWLELGQMPCLPWVASPPSACPAPRPPRRYIWPPGLWLVENLGRRTCKKKDGEENGSAGAER